jgi:hypothetical protein
MGSDRSADLCFCFRVCLSRCYLGRTSRPDGKSENNKIGGSVL